MSYTTRIFCVGFDNKGEVVNVPGPVDLFCGRTEGPTRYVGFVEIKDLNQNPRTIDSIQIAIVKGRDRITERRKKSVIEFARKFIASNYPYLFRKNLPVNI